MSKPILTLTRKDFTLEFFRGSGAGGQNRNKRDTACRITHPASGAVGESCDERQQAQNRKIAFDRLVKSKKFQNWLRATVAAIEQGHRDLEKRIDDMLKPENLKIELLDG